MDEEEGKKEEDVAADAVNVDGDTMGKEFEEAMGYKARKLDSPQQARQIKEETGDFP